MRGKVCDKKDEIFLKIPFTKPGGCAILIPVINFFFLNFWQRLTTADKDNRSIKERRVASQEK